MASEDETDTEKSFAAGTEANDEIPPFLFPSDFLKSDIFPEGFGRYTKVKVSDPVTWEDLESYLNNMISDYDGTWSIYIKDLAGDREISINDRSMEAASLIKLYIMGAVYDQLEKGNLEETQTISDSLYNMITVSDNESANILVRALSPDGDHSEGLKVVNRFIQQNGFQNTEQVNGLADPSLWTDDGRLNHTSARDCGMLLERIYKGNFVSHLASRDMETLLLGQEIDYKIPDSLPDGTISASKTGEVEGCENDTAIVYSPGGDYIICIMSNGWADDTAAVDRIHQLSETVYNYFNNADSKKFSIVAPEETNGLYEYTETETSDAVGVPVKIEDLANTDAQTEETDMGTE